MDEYSHAIEAVAELHNLMSDLRITIGEHDADVDCRESANLTTYASEEVEKLIADLRA